MIKTETALAVAIGVACFIAGALTAILFFWACLERIS